MIDLAFEDYLRAHLNWRSNKALLDEFAYLNKDVTLPNFLALTEKQILRTPNIGRVNGGLIMALQDDLRKASTLKALLTQVNDEAARIGARLCVMDNKVEVFQWDQNSGSS